MFKIGYRTLKTALGTTLAIVLAQILGLENFASAGIITILCIKATKKKVCTSFCVAYNCLFNSNGIFNAVI